MRTPSSMRAIALVFAEAVLLTGCVGRSLDGAGSGVGRDGGLSDARLRQRDGGPSDAGATHGEADSGSVGSFAMGCVDSGPLGGCLCIDLTGYDRSCELSSDCMAVAEGNVCTQCAAACGANSAISIRERGRYSSGVIDRLPYDGQSPGGECHCPNEAIPACVNGRCVMPQQPLPPYGSGRDVR